ncbi:hypothetical protein [Paraburkholderia fungorum]|jgi:hypothetical protein|uniref:BZIP domain-containing protein n=1 Tax=Paraburkholderia fungorum TaxID=134537 RepID=A0AAW3URH0_9BURK|nr:hypothetical protein [Paraburkholderia fungorum]MBB4513929.1 hypothetical protein [Paraburkholderia fungorum]MBB6201170.1 hypothetical protein [Paraburkholderia fungorum]
MKRANPVSPHLAVPADEARASLCDDRCAANRKSTPEAKARKVLRFERARQQTLLRRMESVRAEMTILENVLRELLSDAAFVALLRGEGFVTMPRLLRDRLDGRDS